MKVLIAGSRSIRQFDLTEYIPPETDLIISGGANGIDQIAEAYADAHKIFKRIVKPRYDLYGKSAPLKRNKQMVDLADAVIIIWDGVSHGTKYTAEYAKRVNKLRIQITVSNGK